jgi:hypothetical protein
MRFIIDVEIAHGKAEVNINAATPSTRGEHHQLVEPESIGTEVGTVLQRMIERRQPVELPPGKRFVDVLIEWTATSVVEIPVPTDMQDEDPQLEDEVRFAISRDGLPEVVINPTIEFLHANVGFVRRGGEFEDGGFDI